MKGGSSAEVPTTLAVDEIQGPRLMLGPLSLRAKSRSEDAGFPARYPG